MWKSTTSSRKRLYFFYSCLFSLFVGLLACNQPIDAGTGGNADTGGNAETAGNADTGSNADTAGNDASDANSPPNPTAEQLWKILSNPEKPYTSWPFFYEIHPKTGKPITFPFAATELPHGDYVAIYVNQPALESLKNPSDPFLMKPGSILIKENYPGGSPPPSLDRPIGKRDGLLSRTVMWKVPGYNFSGMPTQVFDPKPPSPVAGAPYMVGGEWFWAMFTPGADAKVVTLGTPKVQGFLLDSSTAIGRQFNPYIGETQAGKSWFCQNCHVSATGQGFQAPNSYGDYIWRVVAFEKKP